MNSTTITLEFEGRRVMIDQEAQEVHVLDTSGNIVSSERLQVAAGSIQGIFSSLQGVTDIVSGGATRRNA